jgi:hypothetical protein
MAISVGPTDCSSGLSKRVFDNFRFDNPWQASTSGVAVGALCCPTVPNGYGYRASAITTGITGSGQPTWPLVLGNTVVDGGVTWTCDTGPSVFPSAKGHAPAAQFGFAYASTDLDYFRLLAYDAARGIGDSIASDKVGPDQRDALAFNGTGGAAINSGNATSTTGSWTSVPNGLLTLTPTSSGSRILVRASLTAYMTGAVGPGFARFLVDGSQSGGTYTFYFNALSQHMQTGPFLCLPGSLSIASHSFQLQFMTNVVGATMVIDANDSVVLEVQEVV